MEFASLADFYVQGYGAVRSSEHIVSGNQEVMVIIHDAFQVGLPRSSDRDTLLTTSFSLC